MKAPVFILLILIALASCSPQPPPAQDSEAPSEIVQQPTSLPSWINPANATECRRDNDKERNRCYLEYALKTNNISNCGGAPIEECMYNYQLRKEISFVNCDTVEPRRKKACETANALIKQDTTYCSSSERAKEKCEEIVAWTLNDPDLCTTRGCVLLFKDNANCEILSERDKTVCEKDLVACNTLNPSFAPMCYLGVAERTGDVEICDRLHPDHPDSANDPVINGDTMYDECLVVARVHQGDITKCKLIRDDIEYASEYFQNIAVGNCEYGLLNTVSSIEQCENLDQKQEACRERFAPPLCEDDDTCRAYLEEHPIQEIPQRPLRWY